MMICRSFAWGLAWLLVLAPGAVLAEVPEAPHAQIDRTELPVKGPWYPPITTLDARDATAPPIFQVKAP